MTVNSSYNHIGIGVIIRDSCGDVLASLQQPLSYSVDSLIELTKGLVMAPSFCAQLGLTYVQFEGDSSHVINAITEKESCPWQLQDLKADCWLLPHLGHYTVVIDL